MNLPIKWSGSKRTLSSEIISYFPDTDETKGVFYEIFCGGASVTLELLSNPNFQNKRNYKYFFCVDNNRDLISLWNNIKHEPILLSNGYEKLWNEFNQRQEDTSIEGHRKLYFNYIRDKFNSKLHIEEIRSIYFLFLLRTSFSGLIRYNSNGEYNSSCHFTRPGIEPSKLSKILKETSDLLQRYDVNFICNDYKNIHPKECDYVFADPPYSSVGNSKGKKSMYHGGISEKEMCDYFNSLPCKYSITYNGDRGDDVAHRINLNNTTTVSLKKQNSSYSRLNGKQIEVEELMYVKH